MGERINRPVAQWLEQGTHNSLVAGSSPAGPNRVRCLELGIVYFSRFRSGSAFPFIVLFSTLFNGV